MQSKKIIGVTLLIGITMTLVFFLLVGRWHSRTGVYRLAGSDSTIELRGDNTLLVTEPVAGHTDTPDEGTYTVEGDRFSMILHAHKMERFGGGTVDIPMHGTFRHDNLDFDTQEANLGGSWTKD